MPDPADNGHQPGPALASLCSVWCPVSCPRRTEPGGECENPTAAVADEILTRVQAHQALTPAPAADQSADDTGPVLRTIAAPELMTREFAEPVWAVPGLVCEGVNLLVGAPKVGKSWLALGLATAVADGGNALGKVAVEPGPVLYLALEDTARRLQSRLAKVLAGHPAPARLALATGAPTLGQGGAEALGTWLGDHPDARLVIVDVFARMRGTPPAGLSAYEADYRAVSHLKKLADDHRTAMVLVHHTRKSGAGGTGGSDFLEDVSGTNGLAGAADATLVLRRSRGQADAELCVTGRDINEDTHALTFDANAGTWHLLDGPAYEHTTTDTRATILRHLRAHPNGRTPGQIAAALELSPGTVKPALRQMSERGHITDDGHGHYTAPDHPT